MASSKYKKHVNYHLFLPKMESANVEINNPPIRHPIKNADAGNGTSAGAKHCKSHSETTELSAGMSHAQESLWRLHGLKEEEQIVSSGSRQCHVGSASVKTEMKVCCASKTHANVTIMDGTRWVMRLPVMHDSMVSSIDDRSGVVSPVICREEGCWLSLAIN